MLCQAAACAAGCAARCTGRRKIARAMRMLKVVYTPTSGDMQLCCRTIDQAGEPTSIALKQLWNAFIAARYPCVHNTTFPKDDGYCLGFGKAAISHRYSSLMLLAEDKAGSLRRNFSHMICQITYTAAARVVLQVWVQPMHAARQQRSITRVLRGNRSVRHSLQADDEQQGCCGTHGGSAAYLR